MAIFRPQAASGGSSYLGYQSCGIASFEDRAEKFDWADVYMIVSLKLENSQYEQPMQIAGSFDREPDGTIKDCTLLRRLYYLFDAIGFQGGVTKEGTFEDADGKPIADIVAYLDDVFTPTFPSEPTMDFVCYVYKEFNEKDGKAYSRVVPKLVKNTVAERKDFEGYVNFCKSKGVIKEHSETSTLPTGSASSTPVGGEASTF